MKNKSVAILDIQSDEVTFLLGSRGVNGTFVFYDSCSEHYKGYTCKEGFLDVDSFRWAVSTAINTVRQNYDGKIDEIHVGVPARFISLFTKGHTNSYPSKRRITEQDVEALYESGLNELLANGKCIRRSSMYFTVGDGRKCFSVSDLYGTSTTLLKGALCYYFIDSYFEETVSKLLEDLGISRVHYIPLSLAQAMYLFPENHREGYVVMLDVGFYTVSISVIYGNGIVHEETYDSGFGAILAELMEVLEIKETEVAEEILATSVFSVAQLSPDVKWEDSKKRYALSQQTINDIVKNGLDVLCENIYQFFVKYYSERSISDSRLNVLSLTGEGAGCIHGIAEQIASRQNRITRIVSPDLPYYDKAKYSSRISLLDVALSDSEKRGFFNKLFNRSGGKRK